MKKKKETSLSKSKYLAGLQCLKRLYLKCHQPELAGEADEASQSILNQGTEVGQLAREYFKGGILVEHDYMHHKEALLKTQKLIKSGDTPAIFEAAFTYKNINIRIDVLKRLPRNQWHIVEVKSSAEIKEEHLPDIAIQKYVAEKCGLRISKVSHMHINRDYVYDGKKIDLKKLFTIDDVKKDITEVGKTIPKNLTKQRKVLVSHKPPCIEAGSQCGKPVECEFYWHCNEDLEDDWIGNLPRINQDKIELLLEDNIESILDIPEDFPLTVIQRRAQMCVKKDKPYFGKDLVAVINKLKFPMYFMDFETANPAIPRYRGMQPYDHIPFQWSIHTLVNVNKNSVHHEFLHTEDNDPREPFIKSLLEVLEKNNRAPILVYYQSFELGRLTDIAKWFPKYARRIEAIKKRVCDLWVIVSKNVYHPEFYGSFSIKCVLPALVKGMSYEGMDIADGLQASASYNNLVNGDLTKRQRQKIIKDLLKYCCQDTLAMVKLYEWLKKEAQKLAKSK